LSEPRDPPANCGTTLSQTNILKAGPPSLFHWLALTIALFPTLRFGQSAVLDLEGSAWAKGQV